MRCPYCNVAINTYVNEDVYPIPTDSENYEGGIALSSCFCPECDNFIVHLKKGNQYIADMEFSNESAILRDIESDELIYPKFPCSRNLDTSIPDKYKTCYIEAEQVLVISPKASATLSRYLLQLIFHEELSIQKRTLEMEIDEFIDGKDTPSNLCDMLHIFRKVANFGAHPKKSTNSNEIVEVENGEAEIMLELIYEVFEFVFVKPARMKEFEENTKERYGIEITKKANSESTK